MIYQTNVIAGRGRGKKLGFPTLNLNVPIGFHALPGIYAGWVWINNNKYKGAFHFGPIPVFNQTKNSLEVFVLNYPVEKKLSTLKFELKKFIRPVKNFPSPQALSDQITKDIISVRQILKSF